MKDGFGIEINEYGRYEGYWKNGMKFGKGKMIFSNGDLYEGFYEQDKMSGYGLIEFKNKDTY